MPLTKTGKARAAIRKYWHTKDNIKNKFGIDAELIEGTGGVFEVTLNNSLIFSKKELGRFPNENEIEDLIEGYEFVT